MDNELLDAVAKLEEWAKQQRLTDRAMDACRVELQRYISSVTDPANPLFGRDPSEVEMKFHEHHLVFDRAFKLPFTMVMTELGLFINESAEDEETGRYINRIALGKYRYCTRLDGKLEEGYLELWNSHPVKS
jgi:hypothetical protein